MGEGEGEGLETGALAPNLLCSVSGFKGEGEHSSEWDLKPVSESLSEVPFKLALSIVSLTARGRPPLTPLPWDSEGHCPPSQTGTPGTRGFTGLWGFRCTWFPIQGGQDSNGCHAAL